MINAVSCTTSENDSDYPRIDAPLTTLYLTRTVITPPRPPPQKYVENVKQDTHVGFNILRVSASDEDADNNGVIVYNLTAPQSPSDLEYFSIHSDSGWITLQKPLDVSWRGGRGEAGCWGLLLFN